MDTTLIQSVQDKYRVLGAILDERGRRVWAAAEARSLRRGGVSLVAQATGMSRTTITAGLRELALPEEERVREACRIRRPGGGRKLTRRKATRS